MKVNRKRFLSKIRELGYSHKKKQTKKTALYHKRGTTEYIHPPKSYWLGSKYIHKTLEYAGLSKEEIDSFLEENSLEELPQKPKSRH